MQLNAALAGLAGVAGRGVLIARGGACPPGITPDEVRARLHARAAQAEHSQDNRTGSRPG